eukprot:TRINITY_DN5334_c0_g2_i1.p1 TRINITY_DN5334_c0_g2~~TRINITY_DN5334_c0_g2_i1.p1  ORF type:complete len:162 (-),score=6.06 TRINITY_DN5334_c0_g2_i1:861-1346(-)
MSTLACLLSPSPITPLHYVQIKGVFLSADGKFAHEASYVRPSHQSCIRVESNRRSSLRSSSLPVRKNLPYQNGKQSACNAKRMVATNAFFDIFKPKTASSNCETCKGKGAITCPGCKGIGRNKKNGNMFERWKCYDCQGFGLVGCPVCKTGGLTPEQRGER